MIKEHLEGILEKCENKNLVVGKVIGLYEYKCKQYTFRDDFNDKVVNFMKPIEQYNRAYKNIIYMLDKEQGEIYNLLKINETKNKI